MKQFISQKEFAARRKKLLAQLPDESIVFISAGKEKIRNPDNHYPFRPDHNFYYLTGFVEPESIAVLIKSRKKETFILFNRPHQPEVEMWLGKFAGQDGAVNDYGADEAYDIAEFSKQLNSLLQGKVHLYYPWGRDKDFDELLAKHVHSIQDRSRMGYTAPNHLHNIETLLHEMRLFKSDAEIKAMRYSAETAAKAHIAIIQFCRPGVYEYQLQAEFTHVTQQLGCVEYSYSPIVAAGNNACVLHYIKNNTEVKDGELVLVDAGCECELYASDITRVFPANGKFTATQKALYEVVLEAQLAGMEQLKPGKTRMDFRGAIAKQLTKGLIKLKLLNGDLKKLVNEKAYAKFYPHSPGHWLGLDTHDVGGYLINNQEREYQAGMVITNEPGIYIPIGMKGVDKKWWGTGIRIEDDVLLTKTGNDVLTALVPKTVEEIEGLME